MTIDNNYISKEMSKKILTEILLSIKSSNTKIHSKGSEIKNDRKINWIVTDSIRITDASNTISYTLRINHWNKFSFFMKINKYDIKIETTGKSYSEDHIISIDNDDLLIGEIYNLLNNLDDIRTKEKINNTLENIISDISTSVDKSYRRDETIDEILK